LNFNVFFPQFFSSLLSFLSPSPHLLCALFFTFSPPPLLPTLPPSLHSFHHFSHSYLLPFHLLSPYPSPLRSTFRDLILSLSLLSISYSFYPLCLFLSIPSLLSSHHPSFISPSPPHVPVTLLPFIFLPSLLYPQQCDVVLLSPFIDRKKMISVYPVFVWQKTKNHTDMKIYSLKILRFYLFS
jgi:hypothetical protein